MSGFVKIYGSILDSSVWCESAATRVVWITMLAAAERHGIVNSSVPGLANRANVSSAQCVKALAVLMAPDKWSKSPEYEGRRIEELEGGGGWRILNYEKYRELRTDEQIAEAERKRIQRQRASLKDASGDNPDMSRDKGIEVRSQKSETPSLFEEAWQAYPKRAGGNPKGKALKAWNARIREGVTADQLIAGVARYAAYSIAAGKVGTEFVMQAATFFGPDRRFAEDWTSSASTTGKNSKYPTPADVREAYG